MEVNNQSEAVSNTTSAVITDPVAPSALPARTSKVKKYLATAAAILLIGLGLLFVLEREGRVDTNFFSFLERSEPAAVVNGVAISKADYDSSLDQLMKMAFAQGASTTDPAITEQFRTQAIDTLINGELLRQAAIASGLTASVADVALRFTEIETGLGGKEQLASKMAEFGISETVLRRDIENEILIQGLFDNKFPLDAYQVTEDDIQSFYTNSGSGAAGLPPLSDIKDEISQRLKVDQQQLQISEYIDKLRSEATIEILL